MRAGLAGSVSGSGGSGGSGGPRYEERPLGVFDRLEGVLVLPGTEQWARYQAHVAETGEEPAPGPAAAKPTLAQAIAEKCALVENLAAQIRRRVVGRAAPAEMASWSAKVDQARAYLASSNPTDAPILTVEASARGTTVDAIAARVMNNASAFQRAESLIAGVAGRHKDAIRGLTDVDLVLAYDIDAGWSPYWP